MHNGSELYRFGPFELDPARTLLTRDGQSVAVAKRPFDLLAFLVAHAGEVVRKETLVKAVWDGVIGESSIDRAIWSLRRILGSRPDGTPYIETLKRVGYRFAAPVERTHVRPAIDIDELLAPLESLSDSRAALDTLGHEAIVRAHETLDDAVRSAPGSAEAHVEMAMACVLRFEATRIDSAPDVASLQEAIRHALAGCQLDPSSGGAWSALGLALHRTGHTRSALAAARKAVGLEPDVARHYMRLAFVSWGDECLSAVRRILLLYPDLAIPHWLAVRVFIARGALEPAMEHLRAGCAAQDAQRSRETSRFEAVGLHLQRGLVLATQGADDDARAAFARELTFEQEGQVYARECAANTLYSAGALDLRCGRRVDAEGRFRQALIRVPGHPLAIVGLRALGVSAPDPTNETNIVDAAMTRAAALALAGAHDEAARTFADALASAQPGPDGWLLPVEPLINAAAHPGVWASVFETLRHRA